MNLGNILPSFLQCPASVSVYAAVFVFECVPNFTNEFPNPNPSFRALLTSDICGHSRELR